MGIDRSGTYDEATSPSPTGLEFLTQYGAYLDALIDTATLNLTNVGGTANAITATAEPFEIPASGYVSGMKFTFTAALSTTGSATLNIDGRGAEALLNADGTSVGLDDIVAGTRYLVERRGTGFRLLTSSGAGAGLINSRTTYDTNVVWSNNLPASTIVDVELWGAGGGGGSAQGGGGASRTCKRFLASDLPSTVAITVPPGGAFGVTGGDCTFGSLLTAFGGSRPLTGNGGNGGGELEDGEDGGAVGGGLGASGDGGNASTADGGGGGGGTAGGAAVYGGGGGGNTGGPSKYGGAGGGSGAAGQRPGGGGGLNAAGGGGRCIITIIAG